MAVYGCVIEPDHQLQPSGVSDPEPHHSSGPMCTGSTYPQTARIRGRQPGVQLKVGNGYNMIQSKNSGTRQGKLELRLIEP